VAKADDVFPMYVSKYLFMIKNNVKSVNPEDNKLAAILKKELKKAGLLDKVIKSL
jgi:hypothetical protein